MSKTKLTKTEFDKLIKNCREKYDDNEKVIRALIDENQELDYKISECERALNEIKYKEFKINANTCYCIDNPNYGYHDVKKQIVKIDAIDEATIKCTKYILKDDDGDEFFYIAKVVENKFEQINNLIKSNAVLISNEEAQNWINNYTLVDVNVTKGEN